MSRKLSFVVIIAALLSLNLACQLTGGAAAPTTTPQPTATIAASPTSEPSPTANLAATDEARASAQSTQEAEAAAVIETAEAEEALAQTAEVEMLATEQAGNMFALITELNDEGYLDKTEGNYYALEDFEESWAQINWYQWWRTGLAPTDFVIRAHTEWESASRTANWFSSGCGFVFREEDENNHYVIFLALDGNVYLSGTVEGEYTPMGKGYYGKLEVVEGSADVILVVEGSRIQYFVNGQQVLDRENATFESGDLGLTLLSGTNKDYGTRCRMTDVEIWELIN